MARPKRVGMVTGDKRSNHLNIRIKPEAQQQLNALCFLLEKPVGEVIEAAIQALCDAQGGRVKELLDVKAKGAQSPEEGKQ